MESKIFEVLGGTAKQGKKNLRNNLRKEAIARGLPEDSTGEEIAIFDLKKDRERRATNAGLPLDATEREITDATIATADITPERLKFFLDSL